MHTVLLPLRAQIIATALVGSFLFTAVPTKAQTLEQVIRHTLGTNPEVLIEVQRRLAADEGKARARAGWFPVIEFRSGTGKEERFNTTTEATYKGSVNQDRRDSSLTLTQMLFDGMGTANEVQRTESRIDSAAHRVAATSEQVSLRAIESYLEILRQQEILVLTQENLLSHERTQDQIQQRINGGFARPSDLNQIRARVALAKANLTTAEANREVAVINYKLVVGDAPGTLVRPEPVDTKWLPKDGEDAVRAALTANRLLHSARADVEAAKAQLRSSRAVLSPRVDFELGKTRSMYRTPIDNPRDENKYAMLRLRYNLFSGGGDFARINESQHMATEAEEVQRRAERQLEQSVRLSWNGYRSARDRLPNLRQHAESSRLTRDAYTKQFSLGQRSLLDMLDSENEFFTAQSNFLNGQYVELFARYRLLGDTGYLLAAIGIDPRDEAQGAVVPLEPEPSVASSTRSEQVAVVTTGTPDIPAPARPQVIADSPAVVAPAVATQVTPPTPETPASIEPTLLPDDRNDITRAIDDWLAAWSQKKISRYFASYSPRFKPESGQARKAWEIERKQRVSKKGEISVTREETEIKVSADHATASFTQNYRSATFSERNRKNLALTNLRGKWLIDREQVTR